MVNITRAQDGETYTWQATKPDGTTETLNTLTYHTIYNGSSNCFVWNNGSSYICNTQGAVTAWSGPLYQCLQSTNQPTGSWSVQVIDNSVQAVSDSWNLSHGGALYITSPSDNQLFDLDQQNYTATSTVPFVADTTSGDIISWAATLNYQSSGGYGITFDTLPGFGTTNGEEQDETYQSVGGQVVATATTTAGDGSPISDCVTFYVDGPQTGIPGTAITGQLKSLYTGSHSYPTDPTGQYPPTSNLMTGVAETESSYAQFQYPGQGAPPGEPDLYPGVDGKWPYESPGGGAYIGLMQIATTFPDAWDWTTNTADAVSLFSGTVSPNKITLAETYATDIINGDPKANPPIDGYYRLSHPVGHQLENMALVLYGGWLSGLGCGSTPSQTCLKSQYYIPSCSGTQGTIKQKGQTSLTCSTGWTWAVNSNQPGGVNYVSKIMSNLQ